MKISKVTNHGQIRFRVNEPQGPDGKRQRKFFDTREAAENYVKERTDDSKAFGIHFTTIPTKERAVIVYQLDRLKKLGWELPAAVDFIEKHGKAFSLPSLTVGTVAGEFIAAKKSAGLRPRYVKTLAASINRFLINRREKLIADITPAEILAYISSNGWGPSTMRSYLVDVRTLFAFALKRKYVRENPALAVDLPKVEENPPGILTPKEARAILDACIDHAPDALPVIVLLLFGGLRRSEAEQLDWSEISDEFVEVKAHKAKTRQRRLVPVSSQLAAWLKTAREIDGKLPPINYADKLKLVLEKSKLRADWSQNALRHSFASYFFAQTKNENETAQRMGNSPQMIFQHYREMVRPAAAEEYFAIMPPSDAVKRAEIARKPRSRVMPPRDIKISVATMSAVFDDGRRTLTRKEAVAALRSKAPVSVAAAYNALALDGRFKAYLSESGGNLTWQHQPSMKAA